MQQLGGVTGITRFTSGVIEVLNESLKSDCSQDNLQEVDDWLTHMAEVQCLCVVERFYGGKTALPGFI